MTRIQQGVPDPSSKRTGREHVAAGSGKPRPCAASAARERLEGYLEEKLLGAYDLEAWEFYTFLLEQAKRHSIDSSGYTPAAYQRDRAAAAGEEGG
jgi:hypothetical protein